MKTKKWLIISLMLIMNGFSLKPVFAASESVEEARISLAEKSIPDAIQTLDELSRYFKNLWPKVSNFEDAVTLIDFYGNTLWSKAKSHISQSNDFDDRSLYWQRLKLSRIIRTLPPAFKISASERQVLLERLEKTSRGITDLAFRNKTHKRILVTGFDPFLLDRHVNQSNPSGVVAMMLDGQIIEYQGITAEINAFMVPVRYGDFDQGLIEQTLAPFYALNNLDLIATISMGRKDFDLERFPGKRRSASAPGNLNIFSGGSKKQPVISKLYSAPLPGPEFVEFSLPVAAMVKAQGPFKINDNRQVTTLTKTFKPNSLAELANEIAVEGGGGGYLSNEISYRSIRLRNELNSTIPTGHIHTPRISQFESDTNKAIVEQIIRMLELALPEL